MGRFKPLPTKVTGTKEELLKNMKDVLTTIVENTAIRTSQDKPNEVIMMEDPNTDIEVKINQIIRTLNGIIDRIE